MKQKQHLNYQKERIDNKARRISSLNTKKSRATRTRKNTESILKNQTGERISYNENDEASLDELTASFIHHYRAPDLEQLSLLMSRTRKDKSCRRPL